MSAEIPSLLLGTAMWGWTIPPKTAFSLLDEWYARGFREIDTATNYPIDKNPEHFRLAEKILLEWLKTHGVSDLRVMMKIGSVNNLRTPEHILTKSFILMLLDEYRWLFEKNLSTIMVHWDNREDETAIRETLEAFEIARQQGLQIGLSGIRHPEIYARLNELFGFDFCIQIKHNLLHSDYNRYEVFHGKKCFIAYGINAGGLKLEASHYTANSSLVARGGNAAIQPSVTADLLKLKHNANRHPGRPLLTDFHHFAMIYAFYHPGMKGILLGTSSTEQMKTSTGFYKTLTTTDYMDVYRAMENLQTKNL